MYSKVSRFFQLLFLFALLWLVLVLSGILRAVLRLSQHRRRRTNKNPRSLLYLAAFFPANAGYRYRVEKWAEIWRARDMQVDIKTVFEKQDFERLLSRNGITLYTCPLWKRTLQVLGSWRYDRVIVRRELLLFNDYGNLFLEKLLLTIHPSAILDIDDDLAASKKEPRKIGIFGRIMREHPEKFTSSLSHYQSMITGSAYLKEKVLRINPKARVEIIPTCVDYEKYEPKEYELHTKTISFGWIGGTYNLHLIEKILPALEELGREFPVKLIIISGKALSLNSDIEIINRKWSLETQIEDLKSIDIGLMPLPDNEISRGKCGFKLIQYMGLGIVSVASAITANKEIIDHGENGFLVTNGDWIALIREVIAQRKRWPQIGRKARQKVKDHYSFSANTPAYFNLLHYE